MKKNVFNFKIEKLCATSMGNTWHGCGFIGGVYYSAESVFCGYAKKEIARILKDKLLKQANN